MCKSYVCHFLGVIPAQSQCREDSLKASLHTREGGDFSSYASMANESDIWKNEKAKFVHILGIDKAESVFVLLSQVVLIIVIFVVVVVMYN